MNSSYDPNFYDCSYAGSVRGDLEWYLQKARASGGPVLELGAGSGRISIPIALDGIDVYALDASERMLERLRAKLADLADPVRARVNVVPADMRAFDLEHTFPLVICPFRAFLHNLTREDQLACLRAVHRHLRPSGCFAFNVFHPSLEFMARHTGPLEGVWRLSGTYDGPDGGQVLCSETTRYDTVRRLVHAVQRYESFDAGGALVRTFLQRLELTYLYPDEIRALLREAGFGPIDIFGGFSERPLENDADELVIQAVRA